MYLFWDPTNPVEKKIIDRQQMREKITSGIFDITPATLAATRAQGTIEAQQALERSILNRAPGRPSGPPSHHQHEPDLYDDSDEA